MALTGAAPDGARARLCCLDLDTFFVSVERLLDPSPVEHLVLESGFGHRHLLTRRHARENQRRRDRQHSSSELHRALLSGGSARLRAAHDAGDRAVWPERR